MDENHKADATREPTPTEPSARAREIAGDYVDDTPDFWECALAVDRALAAERKSAEEQRDIEWQEHLAPLHEGYTGDGCESGDPLDWTLSAIRQAMIAIENEKDDAEERVIEAAADIYLSDIAENLAATPDFGDSDGFENRLRARLAQDRGNG